MSKKILLFIGIFATFGLIYGLLTRQKVEPKELKSPILAPEAKAEVVLILDNLEKDSEIDFSEMDGFRKNWKVGENKETILEGRSFSAQNITSKEYQKIDSFFKNNNFQKDNYNKPVDPTVQFDGYVKEHIACEAVYKESGDNTDKLTVTVGCGIGDILLIEEPPQNNMNQITINSDKLFTILLESNPTTGYGWETTFDEEYIELSGKEFISRQTDKKIVGAGGNEKFSFHAIKEGLTEITFTYARAWEEEPIKTVVYKIIIIK